MDASVTRATALAVASRRRLLETLSAATGPLDTERLAAAVDLHVTTTRHHLHTLEDAGMVHRTIERAGRPGRPRVLYTVATAPAAVEGYRVLAAVLSAEFEGDADSGRRRAERAGRRWAAHHVPAAPGSSLDESLTEVESLFHRFGFAPRRTRDRPYRLLLDACPFRDLARAHPDVVCSVHLGLLRGALERLGAPGDEAQLVPFVQPERCLVDLAVPGGPAGM